MAHMLDTDGHPSFAREVRRAADTIWELRNKLAGVVDQSEENDALKAENAKLRELTKDMFTCISHANEQDWFYFERDKAGCGLSCTLNGEGCGLSVLAGRMRELGIEVGE